MVLNQKFGFFNEITPPFREKHTPKRRSPNDKETPWKNNRNPAPEVPLVADIKSRICRPGFVVPYILVRIRDIVAFSLLIVLFSSPLTLYILWHRSSSYNLVYVFSFTL